MVILAEGFLLVIFFRNKLALLCNTKCRSKVLGLDSNERQINMRHKDQSRPCELHGHLEPHSFRELYVQCSALQGNWQALKEDT